jgi:hypothetical protein
MIGLFGNTNFIEKGLFVYLSTFLAAILNMELGDGWGVAQYQK